MHTKTIQFAIKICVGIAVCLIAFFAIPYGHHPYPFFALAICGTPGGTPCPPGTPPAPGTQPQQPDTSSVTINNTNNSVCGCAGLKDLLTQNDFDTRMDKIRDDYLKPIKTNTEGTMFNTAGIKTYLTKTLSDQENRAMDSIKAVSQTILSNIQALKGDCDSYKAQFGVQAKGKDQVCRSFIENWKYAFLDVGKNVRKDTLKELQRTTVLNVNQMQAVSDQLGLGKDSAFDTNKVDTVMSDEIGIKTGDGQVSVLQPNTTLAGALLHGWYFNTQRIIRLSENQLNERTDQATQNLKNQAIAGQGALSLDEPVYDIVDATTGQVVDHRYSANTTETMLNEEMRLAVSIDLEKAINSTFSPGLQTKLFPSFNSQTGLFEGGVAALRGLANSGNGGPGFFETGPSIGTIPLPATCYVTFADTQKTIGAQDSTDITATVILVNKTTMNDITFSSDNDSVVKISPLGATPPAGQEQTTPQSYRLSIQGLKGGTANISATVSIKNTGATCSTDTPLAIIVQNACTVSTNPQVFVPTTADGIVWHDIDSPREGFSLPVPATITVTKNSDAGLSFSGVSVQSDNASAATSTSDFIPKSLFAFFDTFAQATSTITLFNYGNANIAMTAKDSANTPLCSAQIPAGIGVRCSVASCQGATNQTNILHECVNNQETTEFCDATTGVSLNDGNNAWCVGAVPDKYQNICATQ